MMSISRGCGCRKAGQTINANYENTTTKHFDDDEELNTNYKISDNKKDNSEII